jgi:ubiquitin-activating enzyme E1
MQQYLAPLNPYVEISTCTTNIFQEYLTEENKIRLFLKNFSVVVMLNDYNLMEQILISDLCHELGVKFISAATMGLCGKIFNDFGTDFRVADTDGEQPLKGLIEFMLLDQKITISTIGIHGLSSDCVIKVTLKSKKSCLMKVMLIINSTSFMAECEGNFDLSTEQAESYEQIKSSSVLSFKSLRESILEPEIMMTDFLNFDRPNVLHECFLRVDKFFKEFGYYPKPYNVNDSIRFYQLFEETEVVQTNEKLIKMFAMTCQSQVQPMISVIGGIVSQEAMKGCTGKFTPIKQYMYYESLNCLSSFDAICETGCLDVPETNRYYSQIQLFGKNLQETLQNQKFFVVGSGAIGCELIKNFAMMGVGTMIVTDMDTIEKSNLNRQFLFRSEHIGKFKSEVSCQVASTMNDTIKFISQQNRVGPETENIYSKKFFSELTCVANALDNTAARLYMDKRCTYFGKPLMESGTLGTKGNTQIVIPGLTENYGASVDPPEKEIPICTLKQFPYQIEHTVQWAREQFNDFFETKPMAFRDCYGDLSKIRSPTSDNLTKVCDIFYVLKFYPSNYEDCVRWALCEWHESYVIQIEKLLKAFPIDHKTTEGADFWSGTKKCPKIFPFGFSEDHMHYVWFASSLWANVFGIPIERERFVQIVKEIMPRCTQGTQMPAIDPEEDIGDVIERVVDQIQKIKVQVKPININPFEKDDPTNHHIDFITFASNTRAMNYGINTISSHETKGIAGKIIPAIATTTAVVAGLICLEAYKIIQGMDKIESYTNNFINLAIPVFHKSEPIAVPKRVLKMHGENEAKVSLWDFIDIYEPVSLKQLIEFIEHKYMCDVSMVTSGGTILFTAFGQKSKTKESMIIHELIEHIQQKTIDSEVDEIMMMVSGEDDADIDLPIIRVWRNSSIVAMEESFECDL